MNFPQTVIALIALFLVFDLVKFIMYANANVPEWDGAIPGSGYWLAFKHHAAK